MNEYIIYIDMDDTIERLSPAWLGWLNKKYGTNVKSEDCTDWNILARFPTLSAEQVYGPLSTDEFWDTVEPMEDAQLYIPKLQEIPSVEVYILTATHPESVGIKWNYLQKHFPTIDWKHVIIANKKQLLSGYALIDDGTHNFGGDICMNFLIDQPWNKSTEASTLHAIRVSNWQYIYETINALVCTTAYEYGKYDPTLLYNIIKNSEKTDVDTLLVETYPQSLQSQSDSLKEASLAHIRESDTCGGITHTITKKPTIVAVQTNRSKNRTAHKDP